jgi:hypothetical protein
MTQSNVFWRLVHAIFPICDVNSPLSNTSLARLGDAGSGAGAADRGVVFVEVGLIFWFEIL